MSKFTTEVRFICETYADLTESKGFDNVDEILTTSAPKVFNFNFPIFDEDYRLPLEKKILLHFYTREICEETVGIWKLRLQDRLNMIMPYANQLYESAKLTFDPFADVDLSRKLDIKNNKKDISSNDDTVKTSGKSTNNNESGGVYSRDGETVSHTQGTTSGTNTNNTTGTAGGDTWNLYSDTPQGGIRGIQGAENDPALGTDAYLTNATHIINNDTTGGTSSGTSSGSNTSDGTSKTSGTNTEHRNAKGETSSDVEEQRSGTRSDHSNSVEDYLERVTGKTAGVSYSCMLAEFRETFLNIDKMIIDSLEDLFFGLWA